MIIVIGTIVLESGRRDDLIAKSMASMKQARSTNGCFQFAVSADPIDQNTVNI